MSEQLAQAYSLGRNVLDFLYALCVLAALLESLSCRQVPYPHWGARLPSDWPELSDARYQALQDEQCHHGTGLTGTSGGHHLLLPVLLLHC